MLNTFFLTVAAISYSGSWLLLIKSAFSRQPINTLAFYLPMVVALCAHSFWCFKVLHTPAGYIFSFYQVTSLFFLVMNILVTLSSIKKPVKNLFILLIPLSILALFIGHFFVSTNNHTTTMSATMISHVLLSVIAYSLLTIATLQAMVLAYQYRKLKSKHPGGLIGILPPLQTMEKLMFELVGFGFLLLSLSVFSGLLFIDDMFAQQLAHKTVFSLSSWVIYAIILFGRFYSGWRGILAIRWLMAGFVALMLAYFGSKLALEIILAG